MAEWTVKLFDQEKCKGKEEVRLKRLTYDIVENLAGMTVLLNDRYCSVGLIT